MSSLMHLYFFKTVKAPVATFGAYVLNSPGFCYVGSSANILNQVELRGLI